MKKTVLILFALGLFLTTYSQTFYATTDTSYVQLVEKAFDYLKKGDCQACLDKYEEAFKLSQRSILSRLRAASCAFACKNEAKWKFHTKFALDKEWGTVDNILQDANKQYPELTQYKGTDFYTTIQKQIKDIKIPFFLSGGLSLQKIDSIIEFIKLNPYCIGLDLNSGFEVEPGLKNIGNLKDFIKRVHELRS